MDGINGERSKELHLALEGSGKMYLPLSSCQSLRTLRYQAVKALVAWTPVYLRRHDGCSRPEHVVRAVRPGFCVQSRAK